MTKLRILGSPALVVAVVSLDRYYSSRRGGRGGEFSAAMGEVPVVVVEIVWTY